MKKLILPAIFILLSTAVAADYGKGCWMDGMYGGFGGLGSKFIYFALMSFIFSIIFWLTYNWLSKDKKKR